MKIIDYYKKCTGTEVYRLEQVRRSAEDKPRRRVYTNLEGAEIGMEINWDKLEVAFFIFKKKKRNCEVKADPISIFAGEDEVRHTLRDLVNTYFKMIGKDMEVKMYSMIELSVLASHFNYHAFAGTLWKAVQPEEV